LFLCQFKTRLLSLTRRDVRQAAEKYFVISPEQQAVAVVSNETKLKETNQQLADQPLELYQI
jgi:Zn-dependent M16 (insulinase) family peptidase